MHSHAESGNEITKHNQAKKLHYSLLAYLFRQVTIELYKMTEPDNYNPEDKPPFKPLRVVIAVLLILLGISSAAQWYSRNVTMPRYCEDPVQVLTRARQVLTEKTPAGEGDRKPYIIAARLTFLVPRESNEPLDDYMNRLQQHIDQQCR